MKAIGSWTKSLWIEDAICRLEEFSSGVDKDWGLWHVNSFMVVVAISPTKKFDSLEQLANKVIADILQRSNAQF